MERHSVFQQSGDRWVAVMSKRLRLVGLAEGGRDAGFEPVSLREQGGQFIDQILWGHCGWENGTRACVCFLQIEHLFDNLPHRCDRNYPLMAVPGDSLGQALAVGPENPINISGLAWERDHSIE
jgi:hypothetical protein